MRQQLVQLLKSNDEEDMFEEVALRCFWSLSRPLSPAAANSRMLPGPEAIEMRRACRSEARVIDLGQRKRQRGKGSRKLSPATFFEPK